MTPATKSPPRVRVNAPSHPKRPKRKPRAPVALPAVPPPPVELSAAAAAEWRRFMPALLLLGAHLVLDRALILLYVGAVGDLADARAAWVLRGSPTVVIRPAGERPHPDIATIRALGSVVAKYAGLLGLSARSRKALDISLGDVVLEPPPPAADDLGKRFFND